MAYPMAASTASAAAPWDPVRKLRTIRWSALSDRSPVPPPPGGARRRLIAAVTPRFCPRTCTTEPRRRGAVWPAIAGIGESLAHAHAELIFRHRHDRAELVPVIQIARQDGDMCYELAAATAHQRRRNRHLEAELMRPVRLADTFHFRCVQALDFWPAPPGPLRMDLRWRQRVSEERSKGRGGRRIPRRRTAGIRVLQPALAERLVGRLAHVLQDRQARHQPPGQGWPAGAVGVGDAEPPSQKSPLDAARQSAQRVTEVDDLLEPRLQQVALGRCRVVRAGGRMGRLRHDAPERIMPPRAGSIRRTTSPRPPIPGKHVYLPAAESYVSSMHCAFFTGDRRPCRDDR